MVVKETYENEHHEERNNLALEENYHENTNGTDNASEASSTDRLDNSNANGGDDTSDEEPDPVDLLR